MPRARARVPEPWPRPAVISLPALPAIPPFPAFPAFPVFPLSISRSCRAVEALGHALLFWLLAFPVCALAQDAALAGQRLAASCASCHGTLGNPADASFAPLAGMPPATLTASMRAFRDGSRPATVMHQLSKGFNDEQVKLIADFYGRQKKVAP